MCNDDMSNITGFISLTRRTLHRLKMSIKKADTHISESSTAKISNVANNSDSSVLKLLKLAHELVEKKINLEEDETFFQLFKETDVVHEFEPKSQYNLIHYATFCNLEPLLKLIIKHYPDSLTTKTKNGDLPIHCSMTYNTTKILVDAGSPINEMNSRGLTPLMKAILFKDLCEDVIYYLLENGANPTIVPPDFDKETAKFLTDDQILIECIEECAHKWISKDDKKV